MFFLAHQPLPHFAGDIKGVFQQRHGSLHSAQHPADSRSVHTGRVRQEHSARTEASLGNERPRAGSISVSVFKLLALSYTSGQ